jgi:protein-S-isoprenylcysteine O-methyltransferase Ste14
MGHLLFSEAACALFLLLLGAARYYYFISASKQPTDRSSPPVNWARHVPAYFVSTVWAIYVAWLAVAPLSVVKWDRWPTSHWLGDLLGWIAVPILGAALWIFWYSHYTIGRYWSIQVEIKKGHRLVTGGPYSYVRHPLYTALFVGYLGTLLALQSYTLVAWFPVFVASYVLFAREEESVMERGFGEAYRAYCRRTGMFLPTWRRTRAAVARLVAPQREPALTCSAFVTTTDGSPVQHGDSTSKATGGREWAE